MVDDGMKNGAILDAAAPFVFAAFAACSFEGPVLQRVAVRAKAVVRPKTVGRRPKTAEGLLVLGSH